MRMLFNRKVAFGIIAISLILIIFAVPRILKSEKNDQQELEEYVSAFFNIPIDENIISLEVEFISVEGSYDILFAELLIPADRRDEIFINYLPIPTRARRIRENHDEDYIGANDEAGLPYPINDRLPSDYEIVHVHEFLGRAKMPDGIGTVLETQTRYIVFTEERDGTVLVLLYARHHYWEPGQPFD